MSDVIGRGVIEVIADSGKLNATIGEARKRLAELGDFTKKQNEAGSKSIDKYVRSLQTAAAVTGKTARETEIYKLALRGASDAQLKAADAAIRLSEGYARGEAIGLRLRAGFNATAAAAAALSAASIAAFVSSAKAIDGFNDLKDATGSSVENISALDDVARRTGGSFATVETSLIKFNAALKDAKPGSDAQKALQLLGVSIAELKQLDPAEALRRTAVALSQFADDGNKARIVQELFGKSLKEVAPFLKDLAEQGQLVAKTTTAQAEAAEVYRKHVFALQGNLTDLARTMTSTVIPSLNEFFQKAKDIGSVGNFFKSIGQEIEANKLSGRLTGLVADIEKFDAYVKKNPGSNARFKLADMREEYRLLQGQVAKTSDALKTFAGIPAVDDSFAAAEARRFSNRPKPSIGEIAPERKVDHSLEQEAKALLAFDLEQIKKGADAIINTFSNAEKLLEARRRAGLVDEREYYDSKLGFLRLNDEAQERGLVKEIARLQAEKLSGKDQIDNLRKIADARAKISKVQENAATGLGLLSLQETSALRAIEQGFRDAEAAAQDYLEGIKLANGRDLAGFGAGTQERSRTAGMQQIEDRYGDQRRALEKSRRDAEFAGTFGTQAQKKYDDELDRIRRFQAAALSEYASYYAERLRKEQDFGLGAQEALRNYYDEAQKTGKQIENALTDAFKGAENALVDFVKTGKLDFKSLTDSIITNIVRIAAQQQLAAAVGNGKGDAGWIGSVIGLVSSYFGGSSLGGISGQGGGASAVGMSRAAGGPVSAGGLYQVNEKGPELLNTAGKQYLMMGAQGGSVTPNGGASKTVTVTNNFILHEPASRSTQGQVAAKAGQAIQQAMNRNG